MAGIGFVLKKVVAEDTYLGVFKGYLASAVISSGPWLLSVVTLSILGAISAVTMGADDRNLLFAAILYAFAFSMIAVGAVQMGVTRYLADKLYLDQTEVVGPTFVGVVSASLVVLFPLAALLGLSLTGLPLLFRLAMLSLVLASSGTWLAMIFLSAAKGYGFIVMAFIVGYATSLVLALLLGPPYGPTGYLVGFTVGQMVVLGLLAGKALTEFELPLDWRLDAFGYLRKYPSLVVVGLSYNVAIWADKMVFWYGPTGVNLYAYLQVFPPYDMAMFLSSLATVPGLTVFLLQIETSFYDRYRGFFGAIDAKHSLGQLRGARNAMAASLRQSFGLLLKVQVMTSLAGILLAEQLYFLLGLPREEARFFSVGLLANTAQVTLLISMLILLYFDLRRATAITSLIFLVANVGLTLLTLELGPAWYGLGYMGASLIALAVAQVVLWRHIAALEFRTFASQPLTPKE